jgi:hypothetical protein
MQVGYRPSLCPCSSSPSASPCSRASPLVSLCRTHARTFYRPPTSMGVRPQSLEDICDGMCGGPPCYRGAHALPCSSLLKILLLGGEVHRR